MVPSAPTGTGDDHATEGTDEAEPAPDDPRLRAVAPAWARSWSRRIWSRLAALAFLVVVLTTIGVSPRFLEVAAWIWVGITVLALLQTLVVSTRLVRAERRERATEVASP